MPLRASKAKVVCDIKNLHSGKHSFPHTKIGSAVETAKATIKRSVDYACRELARLTTMRVPAYENYRYIQWLHDLTRPAMKPDLLQTVFLALTGATIEGLAAGLMMIADGRMSIVSGLGYGLSFAAVNISVAVLAGFVARYLNYRTVPGASDLGARPVRIAAALGFAFSLVLLAVLIFSAARTRATGEHSGVFQFQEVGFWQTFDDSIGLGIIALGFVASFVGVVKGYSRLFDPIPGFQQARDAGEEDIDNAAEDIAADCQDAIHEISDDLENKIDEFCKVAENSDKKYGKEHDKLLQRILKHNNSVRKSQTKYWTCPGLVESLLLTPGQPSRTGPGSGSRASSAAGSDCRTRRCI